jgi:hypothetical protein
MFDFYKAFDSVDRPLLWKLLQQKGFSPPLITAVQHLYTNFSHQSLAGNYHSAWTTPTTSKSLHQGCSMSMLLYCLYVDPLVHHLAQLRTPVFDTTTPSGLSWADDLCGVYPNSDLKYVFHSVLTYCIHFGLQLNHLKTTLVPIGPAPTHPLTLKRGQQTHTYHYSPPHTPVKYLGAYITNTTDRLINFAMQELKLRIHSLLTLPLDISTRTLVANQSLLRCLTWRIALWSHSNRIKECHSALHDYIASGGEMSRSDQHDFTSRKLGGLGAHRIIVSCQFTLIQLVQEVLLHKPDPSCPHPLDHTQALTHVVIRQRQTNNKGNASFNYVHNYCQLLAKLQITSPISGQPPITHFFPPAAPIPPWVYTRTQHPLPPLQPADYNIGLRNAQATINFVTRYEGHIMYTDGSLLNGRAGASFFSPSLGLAAKGRVTGDQTSGRAELYAAVSAITHHNSVYPSNSPLLLITDYMSLVDRWCTSTPPPSTAPRPGTETSGYSCKNYTPPVLRSDGHRATVASVATKGPTPSPRKLPSSPYQTHLGSLNYGGSTTTTLLPMTTLFTSSPSTSPPP